MKILVKILFPLVLTACVGFVILTLLIYKMSSSALEDASASSQKMARANAIVELESAIEFNVLNAISLAQTSLLQPYLDGSPEEVSANAGNAQDRIINMRNTYHYIMLGILDTKGFALRHTEPIFAGQSFAKERFFQEAMTGKVAVGDPFFYKNMVVYTVASPVYHTETNDIIGVVFNVSQLSDTISERMLLGDKGYVLVSTVEGIVFIHENTKNVFLQNLNDVAWGQAMLANKQGKILFEEDGRQKSAYYATIEDTGWLVMATVDVKELTAPSADIRNNAIFVAIVILLCLTGIVYFYVNRIIKALLQAVKYTESVAAGNLEAELPFYNSKDELDTLYKSLQSMVYSMRNMLIKAEEGSKLKSEFLANMSHEIRTPLNAVIGMVHLYLNSEEGDTEKSQYIEKVQVAAKSLLGLINNILDISKVEAGMFELDRMSFSLKFLIEQTLLIHQELAAEKNIALFFHCDQDLPNNFFGDSLRIGQVLNNLMNNAIKFTQEGSVTIECKLEMEDETDRDSNIKNKRKVLISVTDTGLGIESTVIEMLFKPFVQADSSINRRFGGTGLGLAISDQIVSMMDGNFNVQSQLGKGTTFSFYIYLEPILELEEDGKKKVSNINRDLSDKRILIAEDNEINQFLMNELLKSCKAELVTVDNGALAVEAVRKQHFDIVFMDIQMPVMDGLQASIEIRKFLSFDDLPIIAVTANAMKEEKEKGFSVGLNDYITKPIDPDQLNAVLYEWILKS